MCGVRCQQQDIQVVTSTGPLKTRPEGQERLDVQPCGAVAGAEGGTLRARRAE